jgi:hypothetical protein
VNSNKFLFGGNSDYLEHFAYIVIEKNGELMVIKINNSSWLKTVRATFRPGNYKIEGNKLGEDFQPQTDLQITEALDILVIPEHERH